MSTEQGTSSAKSGESKNAATSGNKRKASVSGDEPQGKSIFASFNINAQGASLPVELQQRPELPPPKAKPKPKPKPNKPKPVTPASLGQQEEVRRSHRSIKRKKFDDEIVDTAPVVAPPGFSNPLLHSSSSRTGSQTLGSMQSPMPSSSTSFTMNSSTPMSADSALRPQHIFNFSSSAAPSSKGSKGQGKGIGIGKSLRSRTASTSVELERKKKAAEKKKKQRRDGAWKGLGRWKPTDDLALVTAVMQTNDIPSVYRGTKFSCHFTLTEVQTRWHALVYNPVISKLALQAIRNLSPEIVHQVQSKTMFSQAEVDLLAKIKSTTQPPPSEAEFEDILKKNPGVFYFTRTPKELQQHWQGLKQYTLLPDQSVQPLPRDNHILNFLDAESNINDGELYEPRDEFVDHELAIADRKAKREIRHLEAEIQKWQVLVDRVRGDNPPDFDNQTLAVLRGRLVRYLMRSKEITLGRTTKDQPVDVDLKLEGPAWKISRKQGIIKLQKTGEFFISNEGKRSIFVDGKPILKGHQSKLANNSVLEISGLKFVFLINQDLIEALRNEAVARMYQPAM